MAKRTKMLLDIDSDKEEEMIQLYINMNKQIGTRFHKKKEVKPKGGWDVFKFLNFLSYMPSEFTASKVERTKEKGFDRSFSVFWKDNIIFKVLVTNELEKSFYLNLVKLNKKMK